MAILQLPWISDLAASVIVHIAMPPPTMYKRVNIPLWPSSLRRNRALFVELTAAHKMSTIPYGHNDWINRPKHASIYNSNPH